MRQIVMLTCALTVSCAAHRSAIAFRVLAGQPDYLLRSPDAKETPFPEILGRYTHVGPEWVELCPLIELRVENAYFREGASKHGLANFLGTEIARYRVLPAGALEQVSVESRVERRPSDQPPVEELVSEPQKSYSCHRFFYQVLVSKQSNVRSAVLLGGKSREELDRVTAQLLTRPESVCGDSLTQCTVFPEACTVSLEIELIVNGAQRRVVWGDTLDSFAEEHTRVKLFRRYQGQLAPVEVDVRDRSALRLPLLPGDVIRW